MDAKTKGPIDLVIEAADERAARADAAGRGIEVNRVEAVRNAAPAGSGSSLTAGDHEPVLVRIEPGHVQLIELTGKRWKGLMLISLALLLVGTIAGGWFMLRSPRSLAHPPAGAWIGGIVALVGLMGVIVARLGAWWRHG